jgi:hypothetical protein
LVVKLKYRSVDDLPDERADKLQNIERVRLIRYNAGDAPIGMEFIVYGISVVEGNVLYYLASRHGNHTFTTLAALFDIVDPSVSRHWECRESNEGGFLIWPRSWFEHEFYHDRLSDGEPELGADFTSLKALFTAETQERTSSVESAE